MYSHKDDALLDRKILSKARELDKFGIELKGELVPNLAKIIERKNKVVQYPGEKASEVSSKAGALH